MEVEQASTLVVKEAIPTLEDAGDETVPDRWIDVQFAWGGKPFSLSIAESDRWPSLGRVFDLKTALHDLTKVPAERQKILGLVKGKLPPDQALVLVPAQPPTSSLAPGKKFTLVGTPEGDEIKDPSQLENLPDVINDLDVDFTENIAASNRYQHDIRNIRKVKEMTAKLSVNIITPLRPGKKLLVLDIDYTILDTKPLTSGSLPPRECARPYLHEFLEALYPFYDICIWSQTSWIWLETKLVELGMVGSDKNYHISFVLDKTCMFQVFGERDGKPWQHSVKALRIIWNHFPQFNASNTVHIDDLSRNFALNPNEGIKIHAFKNAHTEEARADRELVKLTQYLLHVANVPDFRTITHKGWKDVVKALPRT
ncbi:HAD-superfamily subfamily IIID h [Coprinellus micaceus]|uniref:HAD-superfamily subfamily IIID h n=1 Tax=Coprinellus micaceus TaxID=71717 RepID=A0A4Y7TS86_COPMI|nr:HAD-superfamily subfamily IIID h [Coprinellus micaceus]